MVRLLAIDMDGTCLNSRHRISQKTIEALRAAAAAGIEIVPTTGRTTTCLPRQLQLEHFYRYIISSNGANVVDLHAKENLYQAFIPNKQAVSILRRCEAAGLGLSAHVHHAFQVQGFGLYTLGRLSYGRDAANTVRNDHIADCLVRNQADVEELQLFYFSKKKERKAREIFEAEEDLVPSYSQMYVEVYAREASKGHALQALSNKLQITKNEIACIGDAENDLSMFEHAGVRFAMGNGISALKEKADHILPTNDEDGVAAAIYQYLLK